MFNKNSDNFTANKAAKRRRKSVGQVIHWVQTEHVFVYF